jgi:hypothetical protein
MNPQHWADQTRVSHSWVPLIDSLMDSKHFMIICCHRRVTASTVKARNKRLKHANVRQWVESPWREIMPVPGKGLMKFHLNGTPNTSPNELERNKIRM